MTAATTAPATLREVILDALNDAFWHRRGEIEGCADCTRNPAGICAQHQEDNDAAYEYEQARKHLQDSPDSPEVLAVLAGTEGGKS